MTDKYMYWLDTIEGLGKTTKKNLIQAFGSAKEVYYGRERLINCILEDKKQELFWKARRSRDIYKEFENICAENIQMVSLYDAEYPEKLRYIPDEPFCLYYRGSLPKEELPSVAIIGARECSQYGEYIAGELGKSLGECGIQVISGMAKGIDGISQGAALEAGGNSFGVLGCGVDICYPKSNKRLYERLLERGGIISSYPPGTMPMSKLFPPRNRIVSGLADVLVVIEARQRSGTAITVEMALEQGRDIYAVPGRVTDRLSDGCNKMIKEGAHVFLSPQDFVEDLKQLLPGKMEKALLGHVTENIKGNQSSDKEDASSNNKKTYVWDDTLISEILEVLDYYPQSMEQIMELLQTRFKTEVKQEKLSSELMLMCLYGLANQESSGWFSKII